MSVGLALVSATLMLALMAATSACASDGSNFTAGARKCKPDAAVAVVGGVALPELDGGGVGVGGGGCSGVLGLVGAESDAPGRAMSGLEEGVLDASLALAGGVWFSLAPAPAAGGTKMSVNGALGCGG